jgi:hypothetical protein
VKPEREYVPFSRYTDRGVLAYTGPLMLAGGTGTLTLVAAPAESVVVQGRSPAPEARLPMTDDGTYAYFGDLPPVETATSTSVVDRATPGWLRDRIADDVARVFALYGDRLGPLQGEKPTVFLTFATREHGVSLGGGVLPAHVLALDLQVEAARVAGPSPGLRRDIDALMAHEAAHLWNSDEHPVGGGAEASWLHEGTADALAMRALRSVGAMSDEEYRGALSEAASECAMWMSGGQPLTASTRDGHARAFYVCGSTIELVVEAAVRRRDPKADLFTFWRAVFARVKSSYDEEAFFATIDRLGQDPQVTAAVRRLAHERLDDPAKALRETLARVGVATAPPRGGALPDAYEQRASIPAVEALLPAACAKALAYDGDLEVVPRVTADGACPGLSKGDRIESVAGVKLGDAGATAWAAGYASCQARQAVELGVNGTIVTVACDPGAKGVPGYLQVAP